MSIFAIWNSLFWPKGYTSNLFYYLLSSCCLPDMITMWTPLYVTDRITECEHPCILYTVSQNVNTPVCYRHDQRMWTPLYVTDRITECEHPCILYIEWQNVTMRVYYIQKENVNTLAYYRQNHRMWTPCILHTEIEPQNVNTLYTKHWDRTTECEHPVYYTLRQNHIMWTPLYTTRLQCYK